MSLIFLDIDGVLNSEKTAILYGGFPFGFSPDEKAKFDWQAIGLVRKICKTIDAHIILSSSWRKIHDYQVVGKELDLPIIGRTPDSIYGFRGGEVKQFLEENYPNIEGYVIIDDESDFYPDQPLVKTNGKEGFGFTDADKVMKIFGKTVYDLYNVSLW